LTGPQGEVRSIGVTGRVTGNDFAFIRSALRAGAGIGTLPSFPTAVDQWAEGLVRVLPGWSRPAGNLYFIYPAARHVPKRVLAFRDFVLESFGRPLPRAQVNGGQQRSRRS
jgi:DNA-binding transcriptional LysR family regulator